MASQPVHPGPSLTNEPIPPAQSLKSKSKPTKTLPFDRVAFIKQLEILRAYAAASEQGSRPATNIAAAKMIGMAPETISLCNAFFNSIGLITKADGGWILSPEVLAFFRAYEWNKDTAGYKLGPLLSASWFGRALLPTLAFRAMREDEAINVLAAEVAASPEYERHLRLLLEYLEAGGVILREGGMVKQRTALVQPEQMEAPEPVKTSDPGIEQSPQRPPRVATGFSQMAEGAMRFHVSFNVDMSEMANWRADRISAFFGGIAQVLAAKAEVEKNS